MELEKKQVTELWGWGHKLVRTKLGKIPHEIAVPDEMFDWLLEQVDSFASKKEEDE